MDLHLTQIAQPVPAFVEPADCIRSFVFMANLAAQEATGDTAASTSPERVLSRLRGSIESRTLLFAVVEGPPPLGELSELALPLVPSTGPSPELDYVGFIHIGLPLLEETTNAEVECVLDVEFLPLPGEPLDAEGIELTRWMAGTAVDLTRRLGRSVAQVGVLYPGDETPDYDPMAQAYRELGFQPKHVEHQMVIDVPANPPLPLLPGDIRAHVWPDYGIEEKFIDQVLHLLTIASVDSIYGGLSVEPINWTRERLEGAHWRLRDRRSHTLLVGLVRGGTELLALSELSHQEHGDPEVAEWTLTVVGRGERRQGLGWQAKLSALKACAEHWPDVTRTYTSVAAADVPMNTLSTRLGARRISTSSQWELHLSQD